MYSNRTLIGVDRSPDGQCLVLSSRDGYCTLVIFDDIIPAHHTQQHALQLQSIAHNLSLPLTSHHGQQQSGASTVLTHSPLITPVPTGSHPPPLTMAPTVPKKRAGGEPPLTPAASTDGNESGGAAASSVTAAATSRASAEVGVSSSNRDDKGKNGEEKPAEPPKKKRRVQLTRVGDVGS